MQNHPLQTKQFLFIFLWTEAILVAGFLQEQLYFLWDNSSIARNNR